MRRDELFGLMADPGLKGMRAAYDEAIADGSRRGHSAERILGQLLRAEAVDKRARSIRYQMAGAKLPAAKELDGFVFADGAVDESLAHGLADGSFLEPPRNVVLIGGTYQATSKLQVQTTLKLQAFAVYFMRSVWKGKAPARRREGVARPEPCGGLPLPNGRVHAPGSWSAFAPRYSPDRRFSRSR